MAVFDQDSRSPHRGASDDLATSAGITDVTDESSVSSSVARWTTNLWPEMGSELVVNQPTKDGDAEREGVDVLYVEDNRIDADLIRVVLSRTDPGFGPEFNLHWVQSLTDAFELLEKQTVSVILLDLNLPEASGLDSLIALRKVVHDKPIVVLTGHNDAELGAQAIRHGAQDYLWKNEASGPHLSRALHFALERSKRQHIETELNGAGFIQQSILSGPLPEVQGLDVSARCEPAEMVAGDFYDVIALPDGSLVLVLGDVSGKGLGPALLMAETRGMIRSVLQWETDPGTVLTRVNGLISGDCVRGAFVTVFLAVLAPGSGTVTFGTAGHEGFVLDSQGQQRQHLANPDPPLGIQFDHGYHTGQVDSIRESDLIFSCTDGVTEAYNPEIEDWFGNSRVFETIGHFAGQSAEVILDGLFSTVKRFRDFGQDDMTAILARTVN
jgi:sigma-B regulation protein RsbU (phosphoserine phosphatase)